MERQFKCFLLFSLKEMTARKVAVLLWSASDISGYVKRGIGFSPPSQERIEEKIKAEAEKLDLPEMLEKNVIDLVEPIRWEVDRWKRIHKGFFFKASGEAIDLLDLKILHWNQEGAIDYRKTAEILISCDDLDVVIRYKIASHYCLEHCVRLLWDKLPADEKTYFENIKNVKFSLNFRYSLPFYWPYILKNKLSMSNQYLRRPVGNPISFNQLYFEHSAKRRNKTAAEHFFQKMTMEEREASLVPTTRAVLRENRHYNIMKTFRDERCSDILRYLLSVMTPEQQRDIIQAEPFEVFKCFLDWPYRGIITENAGLLWDYLPASAKELKREIKGRIGDAHFSKWIKEFLKLGPTQFRNLYLPEKIKYGVSHLHNIFDSTDSEYIEEVLRNVSASDRLNLVFTDVAFQFFFKRTLRKELDKVKLYLREATLSEENRKRLKEAFAQFIDRKIDGTRFARNFARFFALLEETDESADSVEGDLRNCSPDS